MTSVRRLKAVGAILGLAALYACTQVWGNPSGKPSKPPELRGPKAADSDQPSWESDSAQSKFARGGVVTYRTADGDDLFAWQFKPAVPARAARPRDYLVMVDTSASQVGLPLTSATQLAEAMAKQLGENDRISIWTVNIPGATRDLTRGFRAANAPALAAAVTALKTEVPLGDTDLRDGLDRAVRAFEENKHRQRVLVFLGDGLSIHRPLSADDRAALGAAMVEKEIAFFPVPLGPKLDPETLHGLATSTGGLAIRMYPTDKLADMMFRLDAALLTPVIYPTGVRLPAEVAEAFPGKLPPLRADVPTLVVGRFKPDAGLKAGAKLKATVEGTVAADPVSVDVADAVAEPELDNFFLVGLVQQWKNAKDSPALIRADRALALSYEQNRLTRDEYLAQAQWAVTLDHYEAAERLFQQVRRLDPNDVEASSGLKLVKKLRDGTVKKEQLRSMLGATGPGMKFEKNAGGVRLSKEQMVALLQEPEKTPAPGAATPAGQPDLAPPVDADELLKQQRLRRSVEQQRMQQLVDEAERQARRVLPTAPDDARENLKSVLAAVREHPDLDPRVQQTLTNRLEGTLRFVEVQGALIKRAAAERLQRQADLQDRIDRDSAQRNQEELTRARMRTFSDLMAQARYEEAYREALLIQQDAISKGQDVPVAATAGYFHGIAAKNLREVQDLNRTSQDRVLLTLLQVEKAHIPFPDEPPVQFPPAAAWRELSKFRKERYENSDFTEQDPVVLKKIKELREKLLKPVDLPKGFDANTPLKDALEFLSDRYDLTIIVDSKAFEEDLAQKDIEASQIKLNKMVGVSLGTVLRLLLAQVNATYIARRDYIEVTTGQRQILEKTIRVYPVADLVIPIPSAVNQQSLNQNLNVLGQQFNLAGQQNPAGGVVGGAIGVFGLGAVGQVGNLGGLGALGLGGLGAVGLGGGAGLAGQNGFGGGGLGFAGQGQQNLGFGGGQTGFGGGQLGQFGNLGGQFGLQGGDQSKVLTTLIQQVVGTPKDWAALGAFQAPGGGGPANAPDDAPQGDPVEAGSLGYYPPARALVVKNTSRFHTRPGGGLLSPRGAAAAGGAAMGALDVKPDGAIVFAPGQKNRPQAVAKVDPKKKKPDVPTDIEVDPRKAWQEALAKGVTDPGLIIATADYLVQNKKFEHAAEFLKANLRQGIVARPWVYEALAVALRESKGSAEEIERALVSTADLEPQDARGFLRASQAMAEHKRYDRALAFCKQASILDPGLSDPYTDALRYAEYAKDQDAMTWAAGNLLRRDWPTDNDRLHTQALGKLSSLSQTLTRENKAAEADRMKAGVARLTQRDLVIRMTYEGEADLDLEVKEPIGTVCSFQHRETPGGGTLVGDTLPTNVQGPHAEEYVAAQAFTGTYEVKVRRVWGRPVGGRATLWIIQHQGTRDETVRQERFVFDRVHSLKVELAAGRRTAVAQVGTGSGRAAGEPIERTDSDKVFQMLRAQAEPGFNDLDSGISGGMTSMGRNNLTGKYAPTLPGKRRSDVMAYQTTFDPVAGNALDLTAQATVSADRRFVRVSVAPVFQTMARASSSGLVVSPLIPGAKSEAEAP